MARVRLALLDHKFILFSEIYQHIDAPKAKRKAFGIVEAAIVCYARRGFDSVTLDMIAREAGVTRPLLRHYFKDSNEIFETAIRYIRVIFQKIAVMEVMKGRSSKEKLLRYVRGCFYWRENFTVHAVVWLIFLQSCALNKQRRQLNTLANSTGADRIANLLETGKMAGEFEVEDCFCAAKQIQAIIAGGLVMSLSENLERKSEFERELGEQALLVARAI